jgi:hypothetical protein
VCSGGEVEYAAGVKLWLATLVGLFHHHLSAEIRLNMHTERGRALTASVMRFVQNLNLSIFNRNGISWPQMVFFVSLMAQQCQSDLVSASGHYRVQ